MDQKNNIQPPFLAHNGQAPEALIYTPSDQAAFHDLTSSLRHFTWPKAKSAQIPVSRIINAAWALDQACSMERRAFGTFIASPHEENLQQRYERANKDRRFYERTLSLALRRLTLKNYSF